MFRRTKPTKPVQTATEPFSDYLARLNQYFKEYAEFSVPYMEKLQWDQLTLFPAKEDRAFCSKSIFSDHKRTPLVGLFTYLALTNCSEMASSHASFFTVVKAKNPLLRLLYSLPNPFVDVPGRSHFKKFIATCNGIIQCLVLIPEVLLYAIATGVSSLYRNSREIFFDSKRGLDERYIAMFGWAIFGLLNIAAQAIYCAANALNYTRKLIDGIFTLSPTQILKNALRLLPLTIAFICYCIPGLQPAGAAITASAGKIMALGQGATVGISIGAFFFWQCARNWLNWLGRYCFVKTDGAPQQPVIERPPEHSSHHSSSTADMEVKLANKHSKKDSPSEQKSISAAQKSLSLHGDDTEEEDEGEDSVPIYSQQAPDDPNISSDKSSEADKDENENQPPKSSHQSGLDSKSNHTRSLGGPLPNRSWLGRVNLSKSSVGENPSSVDDPPPSQTSLQDDSHDSSFTSKNSRTNQH